MIVGVAPDEELDDADDELDDELEDDDELAEVELELDALVDEDDALDELPELDELELAVELLDVLDALAMPPAPPIPPEPELDALGSPPLPPPELELLRPIQPLLVELDEEEDVGGGDVPAAQLAATAPVASRATASMDAGAFEARKRMLRTLPKPSVGGKALRDHAAERLVTIAS